MSLRQITFNGEVQTSRETTWDTTWLTDSLTTWNTTQLTSVLTNGVASSQQTSRYTTEGCYTTTFYYKCTTGSKVAISKNCPQHTFDYVYSGGCNASTPSEMVSPYSSTVNHSGTRTTLTSWLTTRNSTWNTSWLTQVEVSAMTEVNTTQATTWTTEWLTS